jgi:ferritin-like metal-binding protein YciE
MGRHELELPRDLFAHRLRTMLWVEETLAGEILPELYDHVHAVDLKLGLERHMLETEQHVRTVRRALELLGCGGKAQPSEALLGLRREHDELMKLVDLDRHDVVDLMHAEVIAAGEHLEIAAYEGLRATANALGELEIGAMLQEVMEQEEYALELVHRSLTKLLAEQVESARL